MGMIESAANDDHVALLRMTLESVTADFENATTAERRSMLSRTIALITRELRAAQTHDKMITKAKDDAESILVEDELDALRKMKGAG